MSEKSYKSYKTPLRYPGGKSRAVKTLKLDFPEGFTEFRETFLGGGSVAIHIAKTYPDVDIWVNDKYYNLHNFWTQLRDRGEELHRALVNIKEPILGNPDEHKKLFVQMKSEINEQDDFTKAVYFYFLNKCSFSGLGESSSFSKMASKSNFSMRGINKLLYYSSLIKNWKITNIDYAEVMNAPSHKDCFVFLDPPYDIKDNLYGPQGKLHSGFDHMRFYEEVEKCPHNWMITYNSNEVLRERFGNYDQKEWDLTYTMRSVGSYNEDQSKRKELLIANYNLSAEENSLTL
jgi:DNA adenine methylase Dam